MCPYHRSTFGCILFPLGPSLHALFCAVVPFLCAGVPSLSLWHAVLPHVSPPRLCAAGPPDRPAVPRVWKPGNRNVKSVFMNKQNSTHIRSRENWYDVQFYMISSAEGWCCRLSFVHGPLLLHLCCKIFVILQPECQARHLCLHFNVQSCVLVHQALDFFLGPLICCP